MVDVPPASEAEFPAYLYIFNDKGFHDGKMRIPDKTTLTRVFAEMVVPAVRAGKEVMVTDALDFCTFHAKDGAVIFPTAEQAAEIARG